MLGKQLGPPMTHRGLKGAIVKTRSALCWYEAATADIKQNNMGFMFKSVPKIIIHLNR